MEKRRLRYDILLISVVLCLSLILGLIIFLTRKEGNTVKIKIEGKKVAEYSLDADGEYSLNGGTNILKISNGEAYLIHADCPDKTCVKTGKIKYVGESIICLPNKLSVVIQGDASDGVDLVS